MSLSSGVSEQQLARMLFWVLLNQVVHEFHGLWFFKHGLVLYSVVGLESLKQLRYFHVLWIKWASLSFISFALLCILVRPEHLSRYSSPSLSLCAIFGGRQKLLEVLGGGVWF
jgi:hypothetical protein